MLASLATGLFDAPRPVQTAPTAHIFTGFSELVDGGSGFGLQGRRSNYCTARDGTTDMSAAYPSYAAAGEIVSVDCTSRRVQIWIAGTSIEFSVQKTTTRFLLERRIIPDLRSTEWR